MSVREDRVIRPDGSEGVWGVMSAKGVSVGVVALDGSDRIYLVGQYRYAIAQYSWEIIEGCSAPNEAPHETARREILEEAGIAARVMLPLGGKIYLSNSITDEVAHLFIARELEQVGPPTPDATEFLENRKISLEKAVEMTETGEITDAMSIAGILRAARLIGI